MTMSDKECGVEAPEKCSKTLNENYHFETVNQQFARQQNQDVDADIHVLASRLQLDAPPAGQDRGVFYDFVVSHHCAIAWYLSAVRKSEKSQASYFWLSVGLLVAMPLAAIGAPLLLGVLNGGSDATQIGVQVTALMTGILAVHRALSTWVEKRTHVGRFWEASAKLKMQLYSFEDKWKKKSSSAKHDKVGLVADMRLAIRAAERIIQEEQTEFFRSMTLTRIDLGGSLTESLGQAKALATELAHPMLARAALQQKTKEEEDKQVLDFRRKLVRIEEEISDYTELIADRSEELKRVVNISEQESIREEVSSYRQAKSNREVARLQVQSELFSLL